MIALVRRILARPAVCRCGHPADMHHHQRPGTDCGACGAATCRRYRRTWRHLDHAGRAA